jgi:16S rRNA (cytidine1402-2'-O)-methyltransferase
MTTGNGFPAVTLTRISQVLEDVVARPLEAGLHLVATPIGNLGDLSVRAIATLARADVIYCEDTRHSRGLLAHFGISTPLRAYHEHNGDQVRPEILKALAGGGRIALISDAGTPLVSDPGYKLVAMALDAGYRVTGVPGASAAIAGLAQSGLPTDAFFFAGFLPHKQAARQERLRTLAVIPATLVLYEAPSRVGKCLADISVVLGARRVAVLRELTKLHEECLRGTAETLAQHFDAQEARGEFVIVIGPPEIAVVHDADIVVRLASALESMSVRDAAEAVAAACGVGRGRVYDLALIVKRQRDGGGS